MTRIRLRRGTAAAWTAANPTLLEGEEGYETDTGKRKVGDGSTTWNSLDYSVSDAADVPFTPAGTIAATNVQAAIEEVATESYLAGGTDVAVADGGTGASTASGARTNLGLGTAAVANTGDFDAAGDAAAAQAASQPLDSDLTAIAALTTTSYGRALLALANAGALQTAAALVPGTDVEAHDTDLTTIAGLSPTNDDLIQRKAGAWTNRSVAQLIADLAALGTTFQPLDSDLTSIAALSTTSYGRSLLEAANAAALRTAASLVPGTDVQAYDAELAALAGLTSAADKLPYFTGSGTAALADLSSFIRTLLDDANAATARTTLGLGTAATSATGDFDAAGAAAAAAAASQPLDSDLTALAALTTTSFGRALLELADAAALRTAGGLGTAATSAAADFQPIDSDLTAIAALTTTAYGRAFLALADAAAGRTALGLGTLATQSGTFSGTSSGTNTGDQTTVSGNAGTATALQTARNIDGQAFDGTAAITVIAPGTHAATSKGTPVDADEVPLVDSAASNVLKKLTWANLKATLKTYFDTLYDATGAAAAAQSASQPLDSDLTALAGLASGADKVPYFTGAAAAAVATFTAAGRALVDDADAAAQRTTLGLGTAATAATGDFDAVGAAAAAQTASQPVDADLTAIAALATSTFGRSLLTLASAIALRNGGGREPNVTTADDSITAGTSVHIVGDYEIGSGFDTEIGLNACLEVT